MGNLGDGTVDGLSLLAGASMRPCAGRKLGERSTAARSCERKPLEIKALPARVLVIVTEPRVNPGRRVSLWGTAAASSCVSFPFNSSPPHFSAGTDCCLIPPPPKPDPDPTMRAPASSQEVTSWPAAVARVFRPSLGHSVTGYAL